MIAKPPQSCYSLKHIAIGFTLTSIYFRRMKKVGQTSPEGLVYGTFLRTEFDFLDFIEPWRELELIRHRTLRPPQSYAIE